MRASYVTTLGSGDLPGMPLEVKTGSTVSYPLLGGVGSVTAVTDATGLLSSTFGYSAYGVPVGSSAGTYSYGTYGYDSATGLYYARARYYDAASGRFLTEDRQAAANRYAYSHSSPESWVDPSGEIPVRALICAAACAFTLFTTSNYMARTGFGAFQDLADGLGECASEVGGLMMEA